MVAIAIHQRASNKAYASTRGHALLTYVESCIGGGSVNHLHGACGFYFRSIHISSYHLYRLLASFVEHHGRLCCYKILNTSTFGRPHILLQVCSSFSTKLEGLSHSGCAKIAYRHTRIALEAQRGEPCRKFRGSRTDNRGMALCGSMVAKTHFAVYTH